MKGCGSFSLDKVGQRKYPVGENTIHPVMQNKELNFLGKTDRQQTALTFKETVSREERDTNGIH